MTANQWPGPNERQIIVEMLENRDSEHWEKCNELMRWLILHQASKLSVILSAERVDEILQNAMLSVVTGLPHFRSESKITTWLMQIAYTRTIDALRNGSRDDKVLPFQSHSAEDEEKEVIFDRNKLTGTLEDDCIIAEELREVLAEISAYVDSHVKPERNRKIAEKILLKGYSLEETAREVGVSPAVASYVIRTLRRHLKEKFGLSSSSE